VTRAIDSALTPANDGVEVLVVDDASTDQTYEMLAARYRHEPRVRLIRVDVNSGPSAARNQGLAQARGTHMLPLDSDCELEPDVLPRIRAVVTSAAAPRLTFFACTTNGRSRVSRVPTGAITAEQFATGQVRGEFIPVIRVLSDLGERLQYPPFRCGGEGTLWTRILAAEPAAYVDLSVVKYGVDAPARLCTGEQQLRSASCLGRVALRQARQVRGLVGVSSPKFAERIFAAGVYSMLAGRPRRARRLLSAAARAGYLRAVPVVGATLLGETLFTRAFLRYRSRSAADFA
jgi:hypothetical protein